MVLFFKIFKKKHDGERYLHGIPDAKVITPKKMNEIFTALISSLHILSNHPTSPTISSLAFEAFIGVF